MQIQAGLSSKERSEPRHQPSNSEHTEFPGARRLASPQRALAVVCRFAHKDLLILSPGPIYF